MEFESGDRPVIVRRIKKIQRGHHGGAWKVAFADFATAMMAFFLVLWLLEATTEQEKAAISGYFSDPTAFTEGGSPYVIDLGGGLKDDQYSGESNVENPDTRIQDKGIVLTEDTVQDLAAQIESRKFQELKRTLETRIEQDPSLRKYRDQIIMDVTRDGLQIQIVDAKSRPMFDSGSDEIKPYMNEILNALAGTISSVPNGLSITGHTDAEAFTERSDYSNWELSADRANAARRALLKNGVREQQMAQVVGLASSMLYDRNDPKNPVNRRISILVMSERSEAKLKQQQEGKPLPLDEEFPAPAPTQAEPAEEDEFKAFERLRKTMTRKQRDETVRQPANAAQDEVF
ncbi:flagellar motor protein MotB [Ketobacter sp.]|uniref:flagellar motor protein MotB n=1 Tax=Ketobacter sp. TaxID=2083498 RepID=UPI000F12E3A5|nr:flagellar motor protein MotB [Ketobacter sp.]RLT92159.1 MAG: motility protein MotB [Ketobacter sp.]